MKQNKNIFPSLGIAAALLIATMFASCTKAELEAPVVKQGAEIRFGIEKNGISKPITKSGSKSDSRVLVDYDPNDPCSLGLSMTVVDGIETPKSHLPATKGAQVSQKEQLTAFDVVSYFYADEAAEDGAFVFADEVTDGVNTSKKTYYWPSFGVMNFIATYPATLFRNDDIKTIADQQGHPQSFTYTIPQAVEEQQDIMIAMTNDVDCTEGAPVPLQFKHLLAAVQFKVGEMSACKVNSIKLTGVYGGTVTYTYNSSTGLWSASGYTEVTEYTPGLGDTSTMDMGSVINDGNQILLLAPQTTPEGAKLIVSWTNLLYGETSDNYNETAEIDISKHTWSMGTTTSYVLNIDTDLNITIPKPDDQDAHYVMVPMYYNISAISSAITDIKASVEYVNNTATTEVVPSIKLGVAGGTQVASLANCTGLTHLQKQGYWIEEQYTASTNEDGTTSYTNKKLVRGESTLTLVNKSGTVVLFLPENNGTTDREVVLRITGKYKQAPITIGSGSFIQLCPCWSADNTIGVERIESANLYPWGFSYDRKVEYKNSSFSIGLGWLKAYVSGVIDNYVTADGTFIKTETAEGIGVTYIDKVIIDYSALNALGENASDNDGRINTMQLYHFTGGNDIAQIEHDLDPFQTQYDFVGRPYLTKTVVKDGTSMPEDYAAFIALMCNEFMEILTPVDKNGVIEYLPSPLIKDEDIFWYLPSSEEVDKMRESNQYSNQTSASSPTPLLGNYWTSNAVNDNASAYYVEFSGNSHTLKTSNRMPNTGLKVRAVRKKTTAN